MEKRVTASVYSPYLPKHFGGGEKHLLSVVALLLKKRVQVTIWVDGDADLALAKEKYQSYFNLDLSSSIWIRRPRRSLLDKLGFRGSEDIHYAVTDGSIYIPSSKRNILHVQIPFSQNLNAWESFKLSMWQAIQTNSLFTASVIEDHWGRRPEAVIYPVVDDVFFQAKGSKEKVILSIGRFFTQLHSKRQDILISAFRKLQSNSKVDGWRLVLIGAVEDESYFEECKLAAAGLPVEFITSATRETVVNWCAKSSLYWHASGFGIDENEHPEMVEHFGISTAEAMAAGCVPLVVPKGGQREVLRENADDLGWISIEELVSKTETIISSPEKISFFSSWAREQAKQFDTTQFSKRIYSLFGV